MIFPTLPLVLHLLALASSVFAQATTNATCIQDQWTFNDENQSPCLVASYLGAACNHGQWNVQSITPTQFYTGPEGSQVNPCQCSTVTYAMTSACALCQNSTWQTWSVWATSCGVVYESIFTEAINLNTSIPGWAYGDFVTPGTFVANQADANTTALPSTGTPPATATNTNTVSTTSAPTPGATAPSNSTKKSNAGAIAGGVVGGVVLLGLVAGLIAFLLHRRRSHTAPSAAFSGHSSQPPPSHSPLMTETYRDSPQPFNPTQAKFYNPDDPSTFPATPAPGTIYTTDSSLSPHSRGAHSGQYSYVPEV